jgi:hypothetical protein
LGSQDSVNHEAPVAAEPVERQAAPPTRASLMAFRSLWRLVLLTLLIGFAVTAALTVLAEHVYNREQARLLSLRARDASAIVTASLPALQTPLASAAELADATGGSVAKFRRFISPYVGPGRPFDSASLWRLAEPQRGPVDIVGRAPRLPASGLDLRAFFDHAAHSNQLVVVGLLKRPPLRLGYAFTTPGVTTGYAAYAEAPIPSSRRSRLSSSSAFAGLHYAVFLGRSTDPRRLLVTNSAGNMLPGRSVTQVVPFGDSALTLVISTDHSLSGSLPQELPWIIAGGGALLSLVAAAGVLGLGTRRRQAERLAVELEQIAAENQRLYSEQRTIAQTLQHALLPDPEELPSRPGLEASGRYLAGERSVDVGGDWYDVIERSSSCVLVIIGDVSGRGLRAATTMGTLRYATRAYAAQGDSPEVILAKLTGMISVTEHGQLATVSCAQLDLATGELSVCTAGHLPPLLIADGQARYLQAEVGLPIGVDHCARYPALTTQLPATGTLVAFTDGLVERRGESLDQGLGRIRDAVPPRAGGLAELLDTLLSAGPVAPGLDDIAIVGIRWTR